MCAGNDTVGNAKTADQPLTGAATAMSTGAHAARAPPRKAHSHTHSLAQAVARCVAMLLINPLTRSLPHSGIPRIRALPLPPTYGAHRRCRRARVCDSTRTRAHTRKQRHTGMHASENAHARTHTHARTRAHTHARTHAHTHTGTHARTHAHSYSHSHSHTPPRSRKCAKCARALTRSKNHTHPQARTRVLLTDDTHACTRARTDEHVHARPHGSG